MTKDQMKFWRLMGFAVFLIAALLAFAGCKTGVLVEVNDSSGINVGSISLESSTWPIVSYFTGPKVRFWVKDDFGGSITAEAYADMTNHTDACAIYESSEMKSVRGSFTYDFGGEASTNLTESVK